VADIIHDDHAAFSSSFWMVLSVATPARQSPGAALVRWFTWPAHAARPRRARDQGAATTARPSRRPQMGKPGDASLPVCL